MRYLVITEQVGQWVHDQTDRRKGGGGDFKSSIEHNPID